MNMNQYNSFLITVMDAHTHAHLCGLDSCLAKNNKTDLRPRSRKEIEIKKEENINIYY